ncbi:MAG: hypothetical protein ABIG61_10070 [Planctomycetota bacterium]
MVSKKQKNNYINIVIYALLTCAMLFGFAGCRKDTPAKNTEKKFEIDKNFQRGPLTVHVRVNKAKITIADIVLLELEAGVEPGLGVKMPKVDKVLENFGIVDWDNLGNKLDENNNILSTYRYRLEPFLSGTYSLPAFTFEFYDVNSPEDNKYELTTEPIDIEVASLLGQQRAELKIADIEGVVNMPAEPSYWWLWASCAIAIIAGVTFWFNRRRQQVKDLVRIFKPAHEIAYDRLRALIEQDLVKAGQMKEFYERISDIFRHYIEHRFELRAPERTTEEFLAELTSANMLAQPDQDRLGQFLRHCDLVKFARYNPTTEQIQKTFCLVKDFIETTKSDEKKIDVTKN